MKRSHLALGVLATLLSTPPLRASDGTLPALLDAFDGTRMGAPGAESTTSGLSGAAGPAHLVTVVDQNLSVFDKAAPHALVHQEHLATLFGASHVYAPQVLFDEHSGRWFLTVVRDPNVARIHLAVSLSADPRDGWFTASFQANLGSDASRVPGQPFLGLDTRGVYWGVRMWDLSGGGDSMTVFATDKTTLVASTPLLGAVHAFRGLAVAESLVPARHATDGPGAYVLSAEGNDRVRVRRVDPPLTSPTLVDLGTIALSQAWSAPPPAPSLGGAPLFTGHGHLTSATHRDGRLWTAHCVASAGRAACRAYELDPLAMQELQLATLEDDAHTLNPSLDVTAAGHVLLGGTVTAADRFPGAFLSGRLADDAPGRMARPMTFRDGDGAFDHPAGAEGQEWAILSATAVDPVDGTAWTFQEFASTQNEWQMAVAHVAFCATTKYCNPASGSPANLAALDVSGCRLEDGVALRLSSAPAGKVAYLLLGDGSAVVHDPPGAVGDLCVAGGTCLGRYARDAGTIDAAGTFTTELRDSLSGGPGYGVPGCGGQLLAGQTWSFQYWHRSGSGAPSGFSEALTVTFR